MKGLPRRFRECCVFLSNKWIYLPGGFPDCSLCPLLSLARAGNASPFPSAAAQTLPDRFCLFLASLALVLASVLGTH